VYDTGTNVCLAASTLKKTKNRKKVLEVQNYRYRTFTVRNLNPSKVYLPSHSYISRETGPHSPSSPQIRLPPHAVTAAQSRSWKQNESVSVEYRTIEQDFSVFFKII